MQLELQARSIGEGSGGGGTSPLTISHNRHFSQI